MVTAAQHLLDLRRALAAREWGDVERLMAFFPWRTGVDIQVEGYACVHEIVV